MSVRGATPLFVDTGAFYARTDEDDDHHETARAVFDGIRAGDLPYRPLYTSQSVLSELATLLLYNIDHDTADRAVTTIRNSETITVLPVDRHTFAAATAQFSEYDDQQISFVDHSSSILAREHDVEHAFSFDGDFRTLGFTLVPDDTGAP